MEHQLLGDKPYENSSPSMEKPEKARKKSVQKLNPLPSSSKVINSEDSAWRAQGSASQNQVGTAPGENRDKISRVAVIMARSI